MIYNKDILTRKTLEKFLSWYEKFYSPKYNINSDGNSIFYMPIEMAFGVIKEFFSDLGIYICIDHEFYTSGVNNLYQVLVHDPNDEHYCTSGLESSGSYGDNGEFPNPSDAYRNAIIRANNIYNKRFTKCTSCDLTKSRSLVNPCNFPECEN